MDTCTKNLEKFVDLDSCLGVINELKSLNALGNVADQKLRADAERLVEQFRKIVDKYQEQPELLEPHVPGLIERLTNDLVAIKNSPIHFHTTFKFLYQLIKVIGFKSVGRRFPHETDKLPLIIELLAGEDPQDKLNWQTRFVLIVWLSIVILTPFDLVKFDKGSSEGALSMSNNIYHTLLKSLENHDSSQHVTAFCLARFFSRSDMLKDDENLNAFINLAIAELKKVKASTTSGTDDVKLIGYMRTLTYLFKLLPRSELKKRSLPILEIVTNLDIEAINRDLINHLIIKLVQRVGMTLLPRRVATWRHKRGSRILGQSEAANGSSTLPTSEHRSLNTNEDETDDESDSAETIESILNILFVAAQNAQTKIRWSAAKGLARLASRLHRERASDVIDILLSNFFSTESSEYAWHGGCLALAEMSRQGLILEEKLAEVVDVVARSIIYDKIKGSFAVGAHVREAACYVFWAMSRTYEDALLAPHIEKISINLLCTMLFDRELQCRRAASATFQELVGRQGTFNLEGISILTSVDYQSVGIRQLAYLDLAIQVARFGKKYYEPFIIHLIEKKLGHWDVQIRRLASDALAALMLHPDNGFISNQVLIPIRQKCEQQLDNNAKHGAILGLSKVIKSLVTLNYKFESDLVEQVGGLALKCSKQLASRQQAPNFVEAIGSLILSAEVAQFNYSEEILKQWETIMLQALDSDNGDIRNIGAKAVLAMYRYFYRSNKTCQDQLLTLLNKSLSSPNESSRCGGLRALSNLGLALRGDSVNKPDGSQQVSEDRSSIQVESDTPDIILTSFTSYLAKETREKGTENVFANAMAEACESLVDFIKTLDKSRLIISSHWLRESFKVLLGKSEDYTFDKRGDIGVVVRRAAVRGLQELTLYLLSIGHSSPLLDESDDDLFFISSATETQYHRKKQTMFAKIISKILQQAISYNNSAREQAALAFFKLVVASKSCEPTLPDSCIPHRAEILKLFELYHVDQEGEAFDWREESAPIFISLLSKAEYSKDLWIGLMPALGQASELCAKQFRDAFKRYIQSLDNPRTRSQILEWFLETLEKPNLAGRLVTSGLIVADFLLTQGLLDETDVEFQLRFARLCWQSRGHGDPKRLVSVAQVLCSMLQFAGPVQLECLRYSLTLLASGYSKVRVFTAAELYSALLTYQAELEENLARVHASRGVVSPATAIRAADNRIGDHETNMDASTTNTKHPKGEPADVEEAMELLSQTNWSEPLEKLRPIRDEICFHLLVEL